MLHIDLWQICQKFLYTRYTSVNKQEQLTWVDNQKRLGDVKLYMHWYPQSNSRIHGRAVKRSEERQRVFDEYPEVRQTSPPAEKQKKY